MDANTSSQIHSTEESAVRAVEAAYDEAWNRGDADALVSLFAPDAVLVTPYGQVASGATQIRKLLRDFLGGRGKESTHTTTAIRIHFAEANVAVFDGEATLHGMRDREGVLIPTFVHKFTDILVKRGDRWWISDVRAYVLLQEGS